MYNSDYSSALTVKPWPRKVDCIVQSYRDGVSKDASGSFVCHGIAHTSEGVFATLENSRGQLDVIPLDRIVRFQIVDDVKKD